MDWIQVASQFGVPTFLLSLVCYGGFLAYKDLIKPTVQTITDRHLSFLDRVEAAMTRCFDINRSNSEAIEKIADAMEQRRHPFGRNSHPPENQA